MAVKMSVVVPVYNTGEFLEPCLESLVNQSLPADEYEVIFVDDGSTDDTPGRLDRAAAEHAHVTAIHIPNSGWPGKPRNVGIDAARGEYVYFVDHDDSLAPEALERMYAMASRNGADVIIGKIVGHGRRVPPTLFRQSHEKCTVETAPLMESMTPHKGFRRVFLDEHHLRFPEGRRRLEDHVFVVEAYLLADVVSVLSDYTCYHHIARPDAGNAGFEKLEPTGYYQNLREGIDVVERLTEPGPRRDLVMRRWYRVEMLNRAGGRAFAKYPEKHRRAMYTEIRKLALERFDSPAVWEELTPQYRARSALLRDGRYDDLVALAQWEAGARLDYTLTGLEWDDDRLALRLRLVVEGPDGSPALASVDGSPALRVPVRALDGVDLGTRDVAPVARLLWRHRDGKEEYTVPVALTPSVGSAGEVSWEATARLDPAGARGKSLRTGLWDLFVRVQDWGAGAPLTRRVGAQRDAAVEGVPVAALLGEQARVVVPYWTDQGNLSVDLDGHNRDWVPATSSEEDAVTVDPAVEPTVRGRLGVHVDDAALRGVRLAVRAADQVEVRVPVSRGGDDSEVRGRFPDWAPRGTLSVQLPPPEGAHRALALLPQPTSEPR
jgi:glycosyltransferase involved in cell wall biosynthesis